DRLLVELDRLHRERSPSLVLNPLSTHRFAQLVTRDREQPRLRRLRSWPIAGHRAECRREGLGGQVERLLDSWHPAAEEGEHRGEVPLVEDTECLRASAGREQKLMVGALLPAPHACQLFTPPT